jgi:DNA-binding NarL/FixJ family response regulator
VSGMSGCRRLLVVEDSDHLASAVARELSEDFGYDVRIARDATQVTAATCEGVGVAVIDLLFEQHLGQQVDSDWPSRPESPEPRLLTSGLSAIRSLRHHAPDAGIVVWTSGESNRRLHQLYAYEALGIRAFCSKSPGTGKADVLASAVDAAFDGHGFVDPVLSPYLPEERPNGANASFAEVLLADPCKRAIWRAVARGASSRALIASMACYSARTVGNRMAEMFGDLCAVDAGAALDAGSPFVEIARYATRNREFFLDAAVAVEYP